jgi:hypothetical protein
LGVSQGKNGILYLGANQFRAQLDSSIIIEIATKLWELNGAYPHQPACDNNGENSKEIKISLGSNVEVEERSQQRSDDSRGKMAGEKE